MKKITILIPAYNEELNLPRMIEALDRLATGRVRAAEGRESADMTDYEWEFLIVNDGSRDNTLKVARELRENDPRVNIVNLSRNFGKENAMLAGFDFATGDAVIVMDADLQHPVETVPEMVYWWEQGYEDVYGLRRTRGKESWMRKNLSLAFYNLLQGTTRIEILQNVGDFRLLDRRAVDALRALRETQRYTKGLYCWVGYNKKEVLFDQGDREEGVSSFNFKSLLNLAIEGITCFTTAPLRISTVIGFLISLIALIYIIVIVVKTLVWGDPVAGFPTLLCVILFLGGMQLVAIGIIGEYIGRIFSETKGRPVYWAESYNEKKL
ncbi:MAG: glycosyltransferase family 2 protein [Bacteroides sp.]|nr:glycosyltransferase family 2 protein [Bacteroidales bacterium]MBD5336893.1 glycosyltransferase family 2 protein [Bacteroides sp.]